MITISACQVTEKIYEGTKTIVYRGIHQNTQQPVIVKTLKAEYPTLEEIAHLRQEYLVPRDCNHEGIVKPHGLEPYQHSFALILEDFGGQSLSQIIATQKLSIETCLQIAIALSDTLIHLQELGIIHKDIKPGNIIVNALTKQVKLTDFGLASRLSLENPTISNPNLIEGTLAYMSPEQTGRMNRSIDYRTDFYSLGVTLYELLTGCLPFVAADPMEMVHCHIAKQPVPASQWGVPQAISDVVMKLLAKNAEERYQSAVGLKFDLETCLEQIQAQGTVAPFFPGQRDRGSQLLISQKLYGRDQEVQTLMAAFQRVCQGTTEMMLVSGYSGIGKTSVVNEVHKPIAAARGYFISGKFDQLRRNTPYAALIQAFQELIRQLLTESDYQIALWRSKLLATLGPNAQVVIDVIPEVEFLLGPQPDVPKLGTLESQNRFNRVFQQFVSAFCAAEHPLTIFLDDLQWADLASLKLIQLLVTDENSQYLLFIGAYRDNEVDAAHPLIRTLEKIQATPTTVQNITIGPLAFVDATCLIEETLSGTVEAQKLQELSELIFNKTQGNPFFLTQLLKTLYAERLLTYEVVSDRWQWDIQEIQAVGITEFNIVELIARNIQKLPVRTQEILKLAACLGNQFNLEILAIVNQSSIQSTAVQLWSALQSGLILPVSNTYKIPLLFAESEAATLKIDEVKVGYRFLHDRVQQAAYSLIPDHEKQATHLGIGQLLLQNTTPEEQQENIFALVNQLNFGTELLENQPEKDELAKLNLIAGQKAKLATAYESAVEYLQIGLQLLASDVWQAQYDLAFTFYVETVEAEYLSARLEPAMELCERSLLQVKTTLDEVKFQELKIKIYLAQNQIKTVVETGLKVLETLGISLVEYPPQNLNVAELATLPRMTDPAKLAGLAIMNLIYGPACFGSSELALPLLSTMVELSRQYGNSPPSIYAYALHGVISSWLIPDIDLAYQMGQVALAVLHQLDAREMQSKALLTVSINITFKKQPIRDTIEPLEEAIKSALEVGDIEFACHSAQFYCDHLFFVGEHLDTVAKNQVDYIHFITKFEQQHPLVLNKICAQAVANLRESPGHQTLTGQIFNTEESLPHLLEINNIIAIFNVYFFNAFLAYTFGSYGVAVDHAELAQKYAAFVQSEIVYTKHNLYYSLALLAHYDQVVDQIGSDGGSLQQAYLKQVDENQKTMHYWTQHAPMNFQHLYELVEAEKARVLGQLLDAMNFYDRAIEGARKQGFGQEEALGYELAARFYRSLGRTEIAQSYMIKARYGYIRWGAVAKVRHLETQYFDLLSPVLESQQIEIEQFSLTLSTTSNKASALDLKTIIKASQALAGEIILDQLLQKLIAMVIENAGAQRGFLLRAEGKKLLIEVEGIAEPPRVSVLQSIPLEESRSIAESVVHYVFNTHESIVLNNASSELQFAHDPYIQQGRPKSILCAPLIHQGELISIIYLENNLAAEAFSHDRLQVVKILCSQAAIYIKNAQLYAAQEEYAHTLEQRVAERTEELARANEELQRMAISDSLTQVANRRYFDQYLAQEWRRSLRESQPLALILCDVDYFKLYNDYYGHQQGDDCLRQIAQTMKQAIHRPADRIARYGGEEFVVILPNTTIEGARVIAEMMWAAVAQLNLPHAQSQVCPTVTLSLGVASVVPRDGDSPESLITKADEALYQAKREGRNRIVTADAFKS